MSRCAHCGAGQSSSRHRGVQPYRCGSDACDRLGTIFSEFCSAHRCAYASDEQDFAWNTQCNSQAGPPWKNLKVGHQKLTSILSRMEVPPQRVGRSCPFRAAAGADSLEDENETMPITYLIFFSSTHQCGSELIETITWKTALEFRRD
jgi:hypothetical protein